MKTYLVTYTGRNSRFRNFKREVLASTERKATELVYAEAMDDNYFPQDDGSIKDADGYTIAEPDDEIIQFDGGYFEANEVKN